MGAEPGTAGTLSVAHCSGWVRQLPPESCSTSGMLTMNGTLVIVVHPADTRLM